LNDKKRTGSKTVALNLQSLKKAARAPALIHQKLLVVLVRLKSGVWKVGEASLCGQLAKSAATMII
jgi:hypothetical protein